MGHPVGSKGVIPDPAKVSAIQNYPQLQSVVEVHQFLGMASYYWRFIDRFADIAAPLHSITQKQVVFNWNSECEKAFQTLHLRHLMASPILAYPDFLQPFVVQTNASDSELGAILSQQGYVIDNASRVLTAAERTTRLQKT